MKPGRFARAADAGARIFELDPGAARNGAMEGVRGLAVLMVFCVHFHGAFESLLAKGSWPHAVSYFLSEVGHCGVDLFFVLSGYLIYAASLRRPLSLAGFWSRRVRRIYPTFLVVFLAYLLLSLLFPERSKLPTERGEALVFYAGNLLLLAGLVPITPVINVAWSLSFEVFYYALMPLLSLAAGLNAATPRWRRGFMLAIGLAFALLFVAGPLYRGGYWSPARLLMFIVGIQLYETMRGQRDARVAEPAGAGWRWFAFVASLAAYFVLHEFALANQDKILARWLSLGQVMVLAFPFYGFLSGVLCEDSRMGWIFRTRPLRWLGNMSYSYYLVHSLAIHFVALVALRLLPAATVAAYGSVCFALLLPVVLVTTLCVAALLFVAVKKPLSLAVRRTPRALGAGAQ